MHQIAVKSRAVVVAYQQPWLHGCGAQGERAHRNPHMMKLLPCWSLVRN